MRPRAAVLVHLPDGHVRNHAGDGDVDARVLQRQPIDGGVAAFDEEVRRERLVGGCALVLRRGVERHEQGTDDEQQEPMQRVESFMCVSRVRVSVQTCHDT